MQLCYKITYLIENFTGSKQPIHLLDELTKLYSDKTYVPEEESALEIKHSFRHWLLRFPVQCVTVAEGIMWARNMTRILDKPDVDAEELKCLRYLVKCLRYLKLFSNTHINQHVYHVS